MNEHEDEKAMPSRTEEVRIQGKSREFPLHQVGRVVLV